MVVLLLLLAAGCAREQRTSLRRGFPDVLRIEGTPTEPADRSFPVLSDLGAWHAFALAAPHDPASDGGFAGPLLIRAEGQWISPALCRLSFEAGGALRNAADALERSAVSHPGLLEQRRTHEDFTVHERLYFVSPRTALVDVTVKNISAVGLRLVPRWNGTVWDRRARLSARGSVLRVGLDRGATVLVRFPARTVVRPLQRTRWYAARGEALDLAPAEERRFAWAVSFYPDGRGERLDAGAVDSALRRPAAALRANERRWNTWLSSVLDARTPAMRDPDLRRLAVKCVQTLVTNWRSPAGPARADLLLTSVVDDQAYEARAEDACLGAVALARMDPALAASVLRGTLVRQDTAGMLPRALSPLSGFADAAAAAPPLHAWAVRRVIARSGDTTLAGSFYPPLARALAWRYRVRCPRGDSLCAYGAEDGTLSAARRESGAGDAPRFDSARMGPPPAGGVMTGTPVDLNALLAHETRGLARLARLAGDVRAGDSLAAFASALERLTRRMFFDTTALIFRDIAADTARTRVAPGMECWFPLWAGIASPAQATGVLRVLTDPAHFNTWVPFPSVAVTAQAFDPAGSPSRGPVRPDRAWFAIDGMKRAGFLREAVRMRDRLLRRCVGFHRPDGSLRVCYSPLTGEGAGMRHATASAAAVLLLLTE